MKIKQFEAPGLAQYSYVLSSGGEAVVIDPTRDFDRYTDYAEAQGVAIRYVTETHIHADFASGALALAEATGAKLALSSYDQEPYRYRMTHQALRDGDALQIGKLVLVTLHTPGHTPEHLSFILFDQERNPSQPLALFTGDFLFVGSLGRPDLLGEAAKHDLAHELYRSLHERIDTLPDGVQVYPGHGAGSLCGAGMNERPCSTLGYERLSQPLFALDEDAFVREILTSVPPMPTYYPRMKELNSTGVIAPANLPGGAALTPDCVATLLCHEAVTVVDSRSPQAFGRAHILGAVNIGMGSSFPLWAGWLLDAKQNVILVSDPGDDEEARRALVRVGLEHIEGFLKQGMGAWVNAGLKVAQTAQFSIEEAFERRFDTQILDVRSEKEWTNGHIQGATHIPLGDLKNRSGELSADREIIVVCGSGYRSSIAASVLQALGFIKISSMREGVAAWHDREHNVRLSGQASLVRSRLP